VTLSRRRGAKEVGPFEGVEGSFSVHSHVDNVAGCATKVKQMKKFVPPLSLSA